MLFFVFFFTFIEINLLFFIFRIVCEFLSLFCKLENLYANKIISGFFCLINLLNCLLSNIPKQSHEDKKKFFLFLKSFAYFSKVCNIELDL